jgi:hypothetical protein
MLPANDGPFSRHPGAMDVNGIGRCLTASGSRQYPRIALHGFPRSVGFDEFFGTHRSLPICELVRIVVAVNNRMLLVAGAMTAGLVLTGCGSGSSSPATSSTSSPTTAPPMSTAIPAVPTTGAATTSAATCPTLAQANAALGSSYGGPNSTPTAGGGIVCEYTSGAGNAGVTIFAHQSATVFAGQIAHAPGAPAMPNIAGVGDGAFGMTTAGRSIVNAYSNGSRTLVAAQAPGSLAPVEALARVALSDN